jgi:hypothetical protein
VPSFSAAKLSFIQDVDGLLSMRQLLMMQSSSLKIAHYFLACELKFDVQHVARTWDTSSKARVMTFLPMSAGA